MKDILKKISLIHGSFFSKIVTAMFLRYVQRCALSIRVIPKNAVGVTISVSHPQLQCEFAVTDNFAGISHVTWHMRILQI